MIKEAINFIFTAVKELIGMAKYWWRVLFYKKRDLQYEKVFYGKHSRQYFLICQSTKKLPSKNHQIIYFHGGGWQFGAPEFFVNTANIFTDEGYVVFMPSHRRIPFFKYEDFREDLNLMMAKIQEIREERGWTHQYLLSSGMSSGGNLAALLYCDHKILTQNGIDPHIFKGLFANAAPLDLTQMRSSPTLYWYAGRRKKERFQTACPIYYLDENNTRQPILLFHGDTDGIVEYGSSTAFVKKVKEIAPDARIELHTIPGETHMGSLEWVFTNNWQRQKLWAWLEEREQESCNN